MMILFYFVIFFFSYQCFKKKKKKKRRKTLSVSGTVTFLFCKLGIFFGFVSMVIVIDVILQF